MLASAAMRSLAHMKRALSRLPRSPVSCIRASAARAFGEVKKVGACMEMQVAVESVDDGPSACVREPKRYTVGGLGDPDVDAASGENVDAGVYIAESPGKGLGAFVLRDFAEGDMLGDYAGDLLNEDQLQARYSGGELGSYIMAIDENWYIDAEYPSASNWCRYVNH